LWDIPEYINSNYSDRDEDERMVKWCQIVQQFEDLSEIPIVISTKNSYQGTILPHDRLNPIVERIMPKKWEQYMAKQRSSAAAAAASTDEPREAEETPAAAATHKASK